MIFLHWLLFYVHLPEELEIPRVIANNLEHLAATIVKILRTDAMYYLGSKRALWIICCNIGESHLVTDTYRLLQCLSMLQVRLGVGSFDVFNFQSSLMSRIAKCVTLLFEILNCFKF